MTTKEKLEQLDQLRWLEKEIAMDNRRLAELEDMATSLSINLDGMPHVPGYSDKVANIVASIVDLKATIADKRQRCLQDRGKLERYIAEIPDSLTRQVMTQRFVHGKTWPQVAMIVGGNTEDSVKKICYRYLESCPDCPA